MSEISSADMTKLIGQVGELTGEVRAMRAAQGERLVDIRAEIARITTDLHRMEDAQQQRLRDVEDALTERINGVESGVSKKFDGISARVMALENEDKKLIAITARTGALGGGIGGVLAACAVELIKRI